MRLTAAAILALSLAASGQPPQAKDPWQAWRFLLGDWTAGENPATPGATGSSSFNLDIQGRVLVRRNLADYPAQGGKPAVHHEDLMIVYVPDGGAIQAIYWDNEGHVINYRAGKTTEKDTVRLVSDPSTPGPRYRLTYKKVDSGKVAGSFDVAPPNAPDSFKTYLNWTMSRRPGK